MKKSTEIQNISAYKFFYAIVTPVSGLVTRKDYKTITGCLPDCIDREKIVIPFGSKDKIKLWARSFSKKLAKRYTVRICSGRQFNMAKESEGYAIPFTQKQIAETITI